jgi:hypothetical protein
MKKLKKKGSDAPRGVGSRDQYLRQVCVCMCVCALIEPYILYISTQP